AIYDREHKALLRRLFAADSDLSDAEIDKEQQAFRDAIRRLEFGDEPEAIPLAPYRADHPEPEADAAVPPIPLHAHERDRPVLPEPPFVHRPAPDFIRPPQDAWEQPELVGEPAPTHATGTDGSERTPARTNTALRRRSVVGRVIGRTLIALLLI